MAVAKMDKLMDNLSNSFAMGHWDSCCSAHYCTAWNSNLRFTFRSIDVCPPCCSDC